MIGEKKLTDTDALNYLMSVKETYKGKREVYDSFLEIMKLFKAQIIDTNGVILKVKKLFEGEHELLVGFNQFLPKGFEINLTDKVDYQEPDAISFMNKVKIADLGRAGS